MRALAVLATIVGTIAATAVCAIPSMGMYPGAVTPPLMTASWLAIGMATLSMIAVARTPGRERLTLILFGVVAALIAWFFFAAIVLKLF